MTEEVLELLGEVCPVPLLKTEEKLNKLSSGEKVIVKADHTQAVRNIMDWSDERGYKFEVDELSPGVWEIRIVKS